MFFTFYIAFLKDQAPTMTNIQASPYQMPLKSVRPPLIPTEDEQEKQEESFFGSLGKLLVNGWASSMEILGAIYPGFRKNHPNYQFQSQQQEQQQKHSTSWPVQDSYVIPDEDEPPSIETRTPTPRKTYPFMAKDAETIQQLRQSRVFYNGWDDHQQQKQQQHYRYQSSTPHTIYERNSEKTTEIVFGAVQEQDGKGEAVVIKPIDYGAPVFNHYSFTSQINHRGYTYGYY